MKVLLAFTLYTAFAICGNALFLDDSKYCYSLDPLRIQTAMSSTTSPYKATRGSAYNPSQCTPQRIWFLSRHGSRYPSVADGDQLFSPTDTIQSDILANYNAGKTTLCSSDAENIKRWTLNPIMLRTDGPADLSASGRTELINVAKRYQAAFPTLLPKSYSQPHYFFRNSPILRTRQSAQAFAEGLFGSAVYQNVNYTGGSYPDLYLVPFYSCQTWIDLLSSTTSSLSAEIQKFANGPEFQEMSTQVSNKLGFFGSQALSQSTIIKLMTHCQYEQVLNQSEPSPFCSAFSIDNAYVYEYYKDLQFYYMSGYGNSALRKLYKNMACYLVKDMLNFLQATDNQRARLNFGHDVTVQFLMNALGLFEDALPLTAANYEKQFLRKWRTSIITPMAANLAVVRYR